MKIIFFLWGLRVAWTFIREEYKTQVINLCTLTMLSLGKSNDGYCMLELAYYRCIPLSVFQHYFSLFFFYCFRLLTASSQAKGPSVCYQNWRRSTTSLRVKTTQSSLWTMSCLLQTATSFPACSTYGLQARLVKVPLRYCVCVWPAWRGQEAESHSRTCCEQPHERYRMPFIVSVLRIKTSVACFFFMTQIPTNPCH